MNKDKDQNLPASFKPVWNEAEKRFDLIDSGEPMLTREQHNTYDAIIDHIERRAKA